MTDKFPVKYVWSSKDFDKWIRNQQKMLREAGFKISTAGVTHKLLNEVLIPNRIKLDFPVMQLRRKKRK